LAKLQLTHAQETIAPDQSRDAASFSAPWNLLWFGLGLRLFFLTIGKMYVFRPVLDHLAFGSEAGHIARALLTGRGYADPFWWAQSGPTAWISPGFPLLLAGIFKVFGIYSNASGWVMMATGCTVNAAAARWIWEIGARCFGARTAGWAAWLWALSPWAMLFALMLPWETAISTGLFAYAFLLTLRLRGIGNQDGEVGYTFGRWAAWGVAWGLVSLFNPSILVFLPCAGIWLLIGADSTLQKRALGAALAGTIFVAIMAPWWIRNERVFHKFIPARGNLGVEFCNGNCYGVEGVIGQWDHPNLGMQQMKMYLRDGEVAYNRERMNEFKAVVRQHPLEFVKMTLLRMDFYWFGVERPLGHPFGEDLSTVLFSLTSLCGIWGAWTAWRRKLPGAALFGMALLTMPTLYYVVATQERFRHPIEPLLYVLGVYAVQSAEKSWRVGWFGRKTHATDAPQMHEPLASFPLSGAA
jgi:hypothetical protein